MKIGDILYIIAMVVFAWLTFAIVRGNFQRKFDDQGRRLDLIEDESKEQDAKE